jgi:hypothetical protein
MSWRIIYPIISFSFAKADKDFFFYELHSARQHGVCANTPLTWQGVLKYFTPFDGPEMQIHKPLVAT